MKIDEITLDAVYEPNTSINVQGYELYLMQATCFYPSPEKYQFGKHFIEIILDPSRTVLHIIFNKSEMLALDLIGNKNSLLNVSLNTDKTAVNIILQQGEPLFLQLVQLEDWENKIITTVDKKISKSKMTAIVSNGHVEAKIRFDTIILKIESQNIYISGFTADVLLHWK